MQYFGLTDRGKVRKKNEDCFFVDEGNSVFFVADGMGGHNGGQIASQMASEITEEYVKEHFSDDETVTEIMESAIQMANAEIYRKSRKVRSCSGMGTTVEACVLQDGKIFSFHVGDSRLYRVRADELTQLTTDHSYVEMLIENGDITREEARVHPNRNVITRAVGTDPVVSIDCAEFSVEEHDIYLLCTDGLTEMMDDGEILSIITSDLPFRDRAERLVETANERGGTDNITVLMIQVEGEKS